jgi:hypothetical protein
MSNILNKQPIGFNHDDYNKYVKYFLDTEIGGIVYNLNQEELNTFFEMCHRYPEIIAKVFLMPGDALINYIVYGHEFYEALKDPHEGIDYTPSEIVKLYKTWAEAYNIPEPEDRVAIENLDLAPMLEFQAKLAESNAGA